MLLLQTHVHVIRQLFTNFGKVHIEGWRGIFEFDSEGNIPLTFLLMANLNNFFHRGRINIPCIRSLGTATFIPWFS